MFWAVNKTFSGPPRRASCSGTQSDLQCFEVNATLDEKGPGLGNEDVRGLSQINGSHSAEEHVVGKTATNRLGQH